MIDHECVDIEATYDNGQTVLWANPWGLTPQQVVAAMGTRAFLYISQAQALGEFVNAWQLIENGEPVACVSKMPNGASFEFHEDGTATLTVSE